MQLNKLILFSSFIFGSFILSSQNYQVQIESMFAGKDDVDFLLVSANNGGSSYCKYYIADDTLYEVSSRKIAIRDIKFEKLDIYKNVFNTIENNYPWVLTIHPKSGATTFYYGYPVNGTIDLYLPNEQFARQTFDYLKKLSQGTAAPVNNQDGPTPQEFCTAALNFLNDLQKNNLVNYIGEKISTDDSYKYYTSTISFPKSIQTIIVDTNMFSEYYRSAEVLLMNETQSEKSISPEMQKLYDDVCGILKICLERSGFQYTNRDDDTYSLYEKQTDFTIFAKSDPNELFSSLQTQRGLIVNVIIDQRGTEPNFTNTLTIYFKAQ
ncbi:MAG: hypothetical protein ACHQFW_09705 [Chitinophagales bacterium]